MNTLDAARRYLEAGFSVVPVPRGEKGPKLKGWPSLRIGPHELGDYFDTESNIGIILGDASGGLVDVDLDSEFALALAAVYLPMTTAKSGRAKRPHSHWWYRCPDAQTRRWTDPHDKKTIVEIRGSGGQTVVGPSMHPDGDRYQILEGEPALISYQTLVEAVEKLVDAALRAKHGDDYRPIEAEPVRHTPTIRATPIDENRLLDRARRYLAALPPGISGQQGHAATYRAAVALVHGFALSQDTAFSLLASDFNPRCQPPWTDKELRHKVSDAANRSHEKPYGWLRDADNPNAPQLAAGVDLTHLGRPIVPTHLPDDEPKSPPPADPGDFPEDLLDVPGFIREVVEYNLATAVRPQPVLALAGALCLQAVLAGRKVRDERDNRTNIYAIGLARSGAGKEHARVVNKQILAAAGLSKVCSIESVASDSGLVAAVKACPALLIQYDEIGAFLAGCVGPKAPSHLKAIRSEMLKLFGSASQTYGARAYADQDRNSVEISQPNLVLYGTTVPESFFESLDTAAILDGFVPRLLLFPAPAFVERASGVVRDVPTSIVERARWWGNFKPGGGNLGDLNPTPIVAPTTSEAFEYLDGLARRIDGILADEGTPETARAVWSRVEQQACRLALVYACSVNPEKPAITEAAIRWASRLAEWNAAKILHLADVWVGENTYDRMGKRLVRVVAEAVATVGCNTLKGVIGRRKLQQNCRFLNAKEFKEIVYNLLEIGDLCEFSETGIGGTRYYYTTPDAYRKLEGVAKKV